MVDRLRAFLGKPIDFHNGIKIHSPTIDEIAEIGEIEYSVNLQLSMFDKEKILVGLFQIEQELFDNVADENDFTVLIDHPSIRGYICKSLSFFVKDEVHFDENLNSFMVNDSVFIDINNFESFKIIIKEINGVSTKEDKAKNITSKAKSFQDRINFFKNKYKKKDDGLELKDIASILCSADGNGIDIFNVGNLTIYQAYEQFERVNVKESFDRMLPVWANGHLSEGTKLPEWIKRTNF